jgi:hypothetical protein
MQELTKDEVRGLGYAVGLEIQDPKLTSKPPTGIGEGHRCRWEISLPSATSTMCALEGV